MRRLDAASLFSPSGIIVLVAHCSDTNPPKMLIYKDVLTGDEMFTDVYKIKEICDGFFYEVEGSLVTRTDNIDDKLLGANKSAEEVGEDFDANSTSGVDIVLSSHLVEMLFDKRTFRPYIKDYVKGLVAKLESNPEKVADFKKLAAVHVKVLISGVENCQFYAGESMDPSGAVGMLDYREDGVTPFMLFIKDGLEVEKV